MNADIKAKWLEALRSRKYKQGNGYLHRLEDGKHAYCCLGVLCEVMKEPVKPVEVVADITGYTYAGSNQTFPAAATLDKAGISDDVGSDLADMNDEGKKFYQIARWIERNL